MSLSPPMMPRTCRGVVCRGYGSFVEEFWFSRVQVRVWRVCIYLLDIYMLSVCYVCCLVIHFVLCVLVCALYSEVGGICEMFLPL